ncbi:hypothetical protein BGX26_010318 [Mortierella sp. AD094]|nr:hypothetical protein BGX26_010318 [Mortierella sp. AD094]
MGVHGLWAWMRKKKVEPELHRVNHLYPTSLHLSSEKATIRLDFLGSFFPSVLWAYSNHTRDKAHYILESLLHKLGNQQRVVIYFDGEPAEEKLATQLQRQQLRNKAQSRASNVLDELRNRVDSGLGVRKIIFSKVRKYLRESFRLSTTDRDALIAFLKSKGWIVVLCETEADVRIAKDCQVNDIVISRDSDMLIHTKVKTLWRPIGHATQGKFLVYKIPIILASLGLTRTQLTSLGVISRNDYTRNIPTLGIATNYSLVKRLDGKQDVPTLIHQYLELDSVVLKNVAKQSFSLSINVFVYIRQTPITATSAIPSTDTLNYTALRSEFDRVCKVHAQLKKERQKAKLEKRSDARIPRHKPHQHFNRFRTIDQVPPSLPASASHKKPQNRPRYSFKMRRQGKEHDPPAAMTLYKRKDYKRPPDKPVVPSPPKSKKTPIRSVVTDQKKKTLLKALDFEHPLVSLDTGTLHVNVCNVHKSDPSFADEAVRCIQGAVREASNVKRRCQQLVGMYLEIVLSYKSINNTDRDILDHLCMRLSEKDINQAEEQVNASASATDTSTSTSSATISSTTSASASDTSTSTSSATISSTTSVSATDEADEEKNDTREDEDSSQNKQQVFLRSVMACLYSKNRPQNGSTASNFITRLEELDLLRTENILARGSSRRETEYAPSSLVRSVASQMSVELKKQYKNGSCELYKKLQQQMNWKLLPSNSAVVLQRDMSSIENFARLNALAMHSWTPIPLSPVEYGFVDFSEYDLANFFWSRDKLQDKLKDLMAPDFPSASRDKFNKTWCVADWLPGKEPGYLIKRFVCDIGKEGLTVRQQGKAGHRAAIKQLSFQQLFNHINHLRQPSFDPRTYNEKEYVLCGSIRTNGHHLQLLAYKLRELQSVRYRRYKEELLPNRLLTTTGGTDYFLTEIRNLIKSPKDVEDLLGCNTDKVREEVRVLGLDLGQAFVVGASAVQATPPKRRRKKRRKRGKKRGRRGRKKRSDTSMTAATDLRPPNYYNLAVKQKAVYQPIFKFRSWLEVKKRCTIIATEPAREELPNAQHVHTAVGSDLVTATDIQHQAPAPQDERAIRTICDIESSMPPLRGPKVNLKEYLEHRVTYAEQLDRFYNHDALYKRYSWDARKAQKEEYRRIADSLLKMVGGSIGARKKEGEKVIIGVGLGKFSVTTRLTSLHTSFQSYFVQKARSLGYLVVGVNEYYTSQKCPTCEHFVARVGDDIRCYYCPNCKKYMHRDVMAGNNICNVILGHLEKQQRPKYLQPVDKYNNYPWMEPNEPSQLARQTPASRRKREVAQLDEDDEPPKPKKHNDKILNA